MYFICICVVLMISLCYLYFILFIIWTFVRCFLFFLFFFFFKQKPAYEVRISDWSSDVCSSDLLDHAHGVAGRFFLYIDGSAAIIRVPHVHYILGPVKVDFTLVDGAHVLDVSLVGEVRHVVGDNPVVGRASPKGDRKRVVWGKRVAGRVDNGGRGTLKKKT